MSEQASETQEPQKTTSSKYKSIEEAETALGESERKINDLTESISRLERVVSMMGTTETKTENTKESYVPAYPEDVMSRLDDDTRTAIQAAEDRAYARAVGDFASASSKKEAADREWKLFIDENPDLAKHANIVRIAAMDYRQEKGTRPFDFGDMRKEVAKRVRSQIEEIRKEGSGKPIRVETGSEGERNPRIIKASEEEKDLSNEDIVNSYIKDFQSRKQKKLGLKE